MAEKTQIQLLKEVGLRHWIVGRIYKMSRACNSWAIREMIRLSRLRAARYRRNELHKNK